MQLWVQGAQWKAARVRDVRQEGSHMGQKGLSGERNRAVRGLSIHSVTQTAGIWEMVGHA